MNRWLLNSQNGADDAVEQMQKFSDKVWQWLTNAEMWANVTFAGIRILVIFILTRIIIKLVSKIIDRTMERESSQRSLMNSRRFSTVSGLMKNVVTVICNFVMIMLVLSEFNFNLGPLLASAGVVGLAIGFGAQSLVKDVITGFFIIFEDQFAVGDVIQIGTYKGTVEMIGLRTTKLLSPNGEVHVIPNGTIGNVTNYSLANALAVVDVPVKMERSLEATLQLVGEALKGIEERSSSIIEYPSVLGIQSMSTAEYVVRIAARCLPNTKDSAERQIQSDIKRALEEQSALEAAEAEAEALRQAAIEAEAHTEPEAGASGGNDELLATNKQAAAAREGSGGQANKGEK